jgi:hypothetical protein
MRSIVPGECLALLGALFLNCAPANALRGADLADQTVHRYTVVVDSTKGRCSGVVLAQDVVLTAAHCVEDADNLWIGGDRGWGDPTNPPVRLSPVAETVKHPRYDPKHGGTPDLAILKLAKPLPYHYIACPVAVTI